MDKFAWIDEKINHGIIELLYKGVERFRKHSQLDITKCEVHYTETSALAYIDINTGFMHISKGAENKLHSDDLFFVILHEFRHLWQIQQNKLSIQRNNNRESIYDNIIWNGQKNINFDEMHDLIHYDVLSYNKLPWEADANGFAHYAMHEYQPNDRALRNSITVCTKPKEFF